MDFRALGQGPNKVFNNKKVILTKGEISELE